jgi:pyruvate/2-oxoglutarate/acetoin dehydrogenase E1 component
MKLAKQSGIGGRLQRLLLKKLFGYLDAPIERIGAPDIPIPFSLSENYYIPKGRYRSHCEKNALLSHH